MKNKWLGILLTGVLLLAAGIVLLLVLPGERTVVYSNKGLDVALEAPAYLTVSEPEITEQVTEGTTDVTKTYTLNLLGMDVGTYALTERTLTNGSTFLFERAMNDGPLPFSLDTAISGLAGGDVTDWNPETVEHAYHSDFGMDPTVNPFGTVEFESGELLQGQVYVSEPLVTTYPDGGESRLRELKSEVRNVEFSDGRLSKTIPLDRGEIGESWALVSPEPLFSDDGTEADWIDRSLHHQTEQLNWLTADGPYTKLPYSIEPSTKLGYGRTIGRIEDDVALRWYNKTGAAFFETMVLNSRVNLLQYLEEFGGTRWPTEYTSTWLKNAYGVHAPYVDTRYNEYTAFFLDKTAALEPAAAPDSSAVVLYADFLLDRIEAGSVIETEDGLLIVDYFDDDPDTPLTHASLNHELGGLKILLSAYGKTGESKYLDAAELVITGIEQFGQDAGGWIRETGDLWYQARPDGTFSGDDYPQLTLLDLIETQNLLESLGLGRNAYFDELIDSKLAYLDSQGVELIDKVTEAMEG
ncbi:hypothetical protein [Indiicoccus explosivorum]|uniref:hypothetical protein n=1 Tax=Indiicoccus explosivorum TaxID=1917864 RepID=UPI000B44A7C2|nr:hypothetical protein [Indiicoccus explosivorum]